MNTEQTRNLNPLTGLPANRLVIQNLRQILTEHSAAAVYLDLTDFKPYNEVYGFAAGDRVIVGFARMVEKILTGICKEKNFFLGHIGGDDFFFSTRLQFVDQIFKLIDREFIALRESFYSASDKARSSIIAFNRKGEREKFPLMGVCGAAFSPRRENIYSAEEAAAFATYLKDTAKKLRVSDNIFINPEKLDIIPGGLPEFSLDKKIPLAKRRAAIESMGQSGMAHYGRALIKIYYKTDEIMIKKSVLYALGKLRYLPARSLIEKAFNSENAHLRTRAVEAMGSIGGAEDTDKIGAMIKDPNPYTAAMAAKALALTGSPKALSYLKNIPQSAPVRLKMEAANSRALLKDPESIKELGKRIKDANPLLRKKASKALSFIKTPASLKILIKSFLKE
ncbi:MAG: HEAT repeat domain-containing protein, partial [Elusimicrobiota bacterium]